MNPSKRTHNIRRYRNMPMDAVVALLAETRDEDYFVAFRARTRKPLR
jgi:hypothetical protein